MKMRRILQFGEMVCAKDGLDMNLEEPLLNNFSGFDEIDEFENPVIETLLKHIYRKGGQIFRLSFR